MTTHREYLEVLSVAGTLAGYARALTQGATHQECLEVLSVAGTLAGYGWALKRGATHEWCLEALAHGAELVGYSWALTQGATHQECLALSAALRLEVGEFPEILAAYRLLNSSERETLPLLETLVTLGSSCPVLPGDLVVAARACA